eukprot:9513686-Lingulodinium_polyedra.AAC.1
MQGPSPACVHHDVLEPSPLLVGKLALDGEHSYLHPLGLRGRHSQQVAILPRLTEMQRVTPAGGGCNLRRRGQGLYARLLHAPNVSVGTEQALPRRCPASDFGAKQRDAGAWVAGLTHPDPPQRHAATGTCYPYALGRARPRWATCTSPYALVPGTCREGVPGHEEAGNTCPWGVPSYFLHLAPGTRPEG